MEDLSRSIQTGLNGLKAMSIQVVSLMWLRTIMNYQYKYGTSIPETINILYKEGGVKRFYAGIIPGFIQGPICRFGDTFGNALALNLLKDTKIPMFVKTILASMTAGVVRVILTPIDTFKTMSQVEGNQAMSIVKKKIAQHGVQVLFYGAVANGLATFIGHYPWFLMHNYLNMYVPTYNTPMKNYFRNAGIGFCSCMVSDIVSNFLRVIKTTRQTSDEKIKYFECVAQIIQKDGVKGLLTRGLGIRLITNGIQGLVFNVLWKYFEKKNCLISK